MREKIDRFKLWITGRDIDEANLFIHITMFRYVMVLAGLLMVSMFVKTMYILLFN